MHVNFETPIISSSPVCGSSCERYLCASTRGLEQASILQPKRSLGVGEKVSFGFRGLGHTIERDDLAYFVLVRIVHCIPFKLK